MQTQKGIEIVEERPEPREIRSRGDGKECVGGISRRVDDWASEGTGLSEAETAWCLIV